MQDLNIAFLWHMHQPYYKDPLTGAYSLPWVRLHGTSAYYDMAKVLADFPEIKVNINLVPSLLIQILDYQNGAARDVFLEHTLKPAADLDPEEKRFILRHFFMANWETMIRPLERYYELLQLRGRDIDEESLDRAIDYFKTQDYLDLQLLFNLSWFGFMALEEFPLLNELRTKGSKYTEEEKALVVEQQMTILQRLIPLYKDLQASGQIELATSPFYHPILPLVYDTDIARRCMPYLSLPERFQAPEDARKQIGKAVESHANTFGQRPEGLWPSEGSISPELIPLIADAGIRWIATDEEILLYSIPVPSRMEVLYRPYLIEYEGRELSILFRDKELSNMISFTMWKMEPGAAVDLIFGRFQSIRDTASDNKAPPLVTIILDGENPWEYYHAGGKYLLRELYSRLSMSGGFKTTRIRDELERHPPQQRIHNIYSGSWIHHDFDIWIGSDEENRAWDYLKRTRKILLPLLNNPNIPASRREAAWESIYAAEGSDWFWWYGDDFSSALDEEFDLLFRDHLAGAFHHLGQEIPRYLSWPIIHLHPAKHVTEPVNLIDPVLDGRRTTYFEWQGAGRYDASRRSIKFSNGDLLSAIYYGFSLTHCYIRLDPADGCEPERLRSYEIHIHFLGGPAEYRWTIPPAGEEPLRFRVERSHDGIRYEAIVEMTTIAIKKVIELSIPFEMLGWKPKERHHFIVEIRDQGKVIKTYPPNGYLTLEVPDKDFEQIVWSV